LFSITSNKFDEKYYEVYKYGIEILLSTVIDVVLIVFFGTLFGNTLNGLLYLIVFIPLRQFTGGFHAKTHLRCTLCSISVFSLICFINVFLFPYINIIALEVFILLGFIVIVIYAPVINVNKILTEKKAKINKKRSIILYWIICLFALIIFPINVHYSGMIFLTVSSIILMILLEEILKAVRGYKR
jgi:accessory gene regulator B